MLGLLKRNARVLTDASTLRIRTLYCTLVRSQLEYGSVGSHLSLPEILKLERVQRRAKKFTPKTKGDYEVRIFKLNLLSPEHRRFLFDLLILFFIKL